MSQWPVISPLKKKKIVSNIFNDYIYDLNLLPHLKIYK